MVDLRSSGGQKCCFECGSHFVGGIMEEANLRMFCWCGAVRAGIRGVTLLYCINVFL